MCKHAEWVKELRRWNEGQVEGYWPMGTGLVVQVKRVEIRYCPWCGEELGGEDGLLPIGG